MEGKLFWGIGAVLGIMVLVVYACVPPAPKGVPTPSPVLAPEEKGSSKTSLVAPPPSEDLPVHEDLRRLPEPGPPFGWENRNPEVVLKGLPRDAFGTVDWVKSVLEGKVKPHESLDLTRPPLPPFKFNVEIPTVGSMPNVIFPHEAHTLWLDCGNCHPGLFVMKKGANPISMVKIVNGQFCGVCHGRVSFPLANCARCHVKPKE